ncbi:MAG: class I SAM-dependent methyltransferase [bacterium]
MSLDSLTSYSTAVVLAEAEAVDGNVTIYELLCLARTVRERQPATILEIGTFDGRTTLNLALNASRDAIVYTIDLPPATPTRFELSVDDWKYVEKPSSGSRFKDKSVDQQIRQLYGDSASFDFSTYSADFVFIDGSHTYEYVMSDSMTALRLLASSRGLIAWHDYGTWEGVTRALNELHAADPRFARLTNIEGTSLAVLVLS